MMDDGHIVSDVILKWATVKTVDTPNSLMITPLIKLSRPISYHYSPRVFITKEIVK